MHLEIDRRDIRSTRVVETSAPTGLAEGQVVLKLERAALTSNNVSYALSGDMLDYWGFFPAESGWGRLPVMGFGVVSASKNADIAVGGRYFGFFPLGDHHVVNASSSRGGFVDAAPWREKHAMAYRSFDRADPTPHDDAILILRGLFLTSYLLEDFLRERENFGAEQVVITSASSKTSIALAHCVQRFSGLAVVGLTSSKNAAFTSGLGEYDSVITYDEVSAITNVPTIVVDMAGNPSIVGNVHRALAGSVKHSCSVGATHWDAQRAGADVPPPKPEFFFAPTLIAQRTKEWGREGFEARVGSAWETWVEWCGSWMVIDQTFGIDAMTTMYQKLLAGDTNPRHGVVARI